MSMNLENIAYELRSYKDEIGVRITVKHSNCLYTENEKFFIDLDTAFNYLKGFIQGCETSGMFRD